MTARAAKARGPAKPAAAPKAGWERGQLSVRLAPSRRDRLRVISDGMPAGTTPNQAIDRAIELALSFRQSQAAAAAAARAAGPDPGAGAIEPSAELRLASRLDGLDALARGEALARARDAQALRGELAETSAQLRSLAALISAAAGMASAGGQAEGDGADSERDGDGADSAQAMQERARTKSLRAWLDARAAREGGVAAVARWRSTSRVGDRLVAVEFELEEPGGGRGRELARVSPVELSHPMAGAMASGPLSLRCRREAGGGWLVEAALAGGDRSAVGSFRT